jgi:23S rRNA (cytidine1920-2'-O)/16S rRNA (cytidine1409-2'-O)-methyltransferase
MAKTRIDVYLVEAGLCESREKAKRTVMAGLVLVNERPVFKPGETFKEDDLATARLKGDFCPYVSRGGFKLEKAISAFNIEMKDKIMLDVGSSTGGFTDCALQNGAKTVYALDVGTNQLVYKLREDNRVKVFEKTNFRTIGDDFFDVKFDVITMDVSFISAKLLVENVAKNLSENGIFICLIKPQFEAGIDAERNAKGVITDTDIHFKVVVDFIEDIQKYGLYVNDVINSPIKGQNGNREFLALVTNANNIIVEQQKVKKVVYNY